MTITQLCKQAHKTAIDKGFWIPMEDEMSVQIDERPNRIPKVRYRNIAELLMLVVSELGEACEALRDNNRQSKRINISKKENKKEYPKCKIYNWKWCKDTFEDEIADCFIRLADMCEALNIDIEWQIKKKMEYNKTRPEKHGKEF